MPAPGGSTGGVGVVARPTQGPQPVPRIGVWHSGRDKFSSGAGVMVRHLGGLSTQYADRVAFQVGDAAAAPPLVVSTFGRGCLGSVLASVLGAAGGAGSGGDGVAAAGAHPGGTVGHASAPFAERCGARVDTRVTGARVDQSACFVHTGPGSTACRVVVEHVSDAVARPIGSVGHPQAPLAPLVHRGWLHVAELGHFVGGQQVLLVVAQGAGAYPGLPELGGAFVESVALFGVGVGEGVPVGAGDPARAIQWAVSGPRPRVAGLAAWTHAAGVLRSARMPHSREYSSHV